MDLARRDEKEGPLHRYDGASPEARDMAHCLYRSVPSISTLRAGGENGNRILGPRSVGFKYLRGFISHQSLISRVTHVLGSITTFFFALHLTIFYLFAFRCLAICKFPQPPRRCAAAATAPRLAPRFWAQAPRTPLQHPTLATGSARRSWTSWRMTGTP